MPAAAGAWTWPVAGPVLQGFAFDEENPLVPGQHRGIDIQGTVGDPVLAPAAGTVTIVGTSGVPAHPVPYVQLGIRLSSDPQGYLDPLGFLPPVAAPAPVPSETPTPAPAPAGSPAPAPATPPVAPSL